MTIEINLVAAKQLFDLDLDIEVPVFTTKNEYVPEIDSSYCFDHDTVLAILAGFKHNLRVMLQGYHGTGKSTHLEQVAARLNWPCIRVNLDGHLSRTDFIGRDTIIIKDGLQVTEFQEGLLPWSLRKPMALIFDEYDAARPELMFVLQRILENEGKLALIDQNQVITPHQYFRIFATTNTIGLGDSTGLYHGAHLINQGQMDRWNIVSVLNYLPLEKEIEIVSNKVSGFETEMIKEMIELAALIRKGFMAGDISCVMSPRAVINWAQNMLIFNCLETAFRLSFLNKCDEIEKPIIAEYYQRIFNERIKEYID